MPFSFLNNICKKGFTLVEVLLTVGIITILTAAILPSVGNFSDANILSQAAQNLASDIENVKFKSLSGIYGDTNGNFKNWGFRCNGSSVTSYTLNSYGDSPTFTSNSSARTVTLPGSTVISCGTPTFILFERITGKLLSGGGSTISVTKNSKTIEVSVDNVGNISIKKIP